MSGVILGSAGYIELERTSNNLPIRSKLDPEDVNVARSRFSLDYDTEALITGDRIQISTLDQSDLQLVAGHTYPDGSWYCHLDPAGGIYLYDDYGDAINGEENKALALMAPLVAQEVVVELARDRFRCLADCRSWSMTTSREQVDISSLGEEYRTNYTNGMVSGQGTLNCFWNYKACLCENEDVNFSHYLSQLVIRTKLGGAFKGRFFLKGGPDDFIWYEALCIITNVAMSFQVDQPVNSEIEFVTSGAIDLKMGMPPSYLLQESDDFILQEDDASRLMLSS